ncbi:phenylalanine--tRNA ligase subunit beta [Candidatus Micrarchaeota archaeon CG10_big_fil_rev_8_21_14_0_10_45_29]|nr:MAG: phenylalanine--tRNA ligase subunit beta [Candidatus Micrarchaeota archaeon CG10_big_fil_rev_8_21_14_0_10_45_29]
MAIIKISQKTLCSLSGMQPAKVEQVLTELGIPIDASDGDSLSLEITPNRPDWLSVEGVARSCKSYISAKAPYYACKKSKINFTADSSVKSIRPHIGSALIENVRLDDEFLGSIIQLQEKLHDTLGRGRKRMAIGLHDASQISPPFTYKAVPPDSASFVALGDSSPSTCAQMLKNHEKGIKFSHLVKGKCPLIIDKNKKILSFPPIINGELTRVGKKTKTILLDCTGTHEGVVRCTVNILCAAFADMGAKISTVKINGKEYPLFEPIKTTLALKEANSLLGLNLDKKAAARHLARMGHSISGNTVLSPAFRADIMHPVDLSEDIAISFGYNNFKPTLPSFSTTGKTQSFSHIHEAAIGLGYFEALSWILTSADVLKKAQAQKGSLKVKNPLTEEFTTMRPALYPNLLQIFANSKSQPMPQCLYELGPVILASGKTNSQKTNFCMATAQPKASFTQILSHLKGFLQAAGAPPLTLSGHDAPGFILGRCAKIKIGGKDAGIAGEIHPEVLEGFSIEQPVALFEIDASTI